MLRWYPFLTRGYTDGTVHLSDSSQSVSSSLSCLSCSAPTNKSTLLLLLLLLLKQGNPTPRLMALKKRNHELESIMAPSALAGGSRPVWPPCGHAVTLKMPVPASEPKCARATANQRSGCILLLLFPLLIYGLYICMHPTRFHSHAAIAFHSR